MEKNIEEKILEELLSQTTAGVTTYSDVSDIFDKLKSKLLQKLIDAEYNEHMTYEKGSHEEKETKNRRNGKGSTKTVKSKNGTFTITMPRDREGSFEPILVPKRARMVEGLSDQITLLYAKGNSIRDIKDILVGIYGTKINEEFISEATSMVNEEVKMWKQRPLKNIYSIISSCY